MSTTKLKVVAEDLYAKELWAKLGNLDNIHVGFNRILVAQYIRPDKVGSLYVAPMTQKEDQWQGKAALVIKMGPQAFADDANITFDDSDKAAIQVGAWVMVRPSDGQQCKVNGVLCKLIEERNVYMVIDKPERIY